MPAPPGEITERVRTTKPIKFYQVRLVPRWLSAWGFIGDGLNFVANLVSLFAAQRAGRRSRGGENSHARACERGLDHHWPGSPLLALRHTSTPLPMGATSASTRTSACVRSSSSRKASA